MENGRFENRLGLLIISLLRGRSLSMRKLSAITDIDTATISRIVNGKQQAKPKHIERFAEALQVSPNLLYKAAGSAALDSKQPEDILYSVDDAIQDILKSYLSEQQYTKGRVEQELKKLRTVC